MQPPAFAARLLRASAVCAVQLWAAACAPAVAQTAPVADDGSVDGRLRINGFGTFGITSSHAPAGWGFRREGSQPLNDGGVRANVDSRLGLQGNYAVSSRFEVVAQAVLKDRVASTPAQEAVEWAFAAWRPTEALTLRLGRINPDFFMLSDYRNVGFAQTLARPDPLFYAGLPIYSVQGGDAAWHWMRDDALWKAKVAVAGGGKVRAPLPLGGAAADEDVTVTIGRNYNATLSRESDGLTVRVNASRARAGQAPVAAIQPLLSGLAALGGLPLGDVATQASALRSRIDAGTGGAVVFLGLAVAYDKGDWLLAAEAAHVGGSVDRALGRFAYASVGRRFGDVTLTAGIGTARKARATEQPPDWQTALLPVFGAQGAAQAQLLADAATQAVSAGRLDADSLAIGLRWDFHPQVALKLQWDGFNIRSSGAALWANSTGAPARASVGTALLDFVF